MFLFFSKRQLTKNYTYSYKYTYIIHVYIVLYSLFGTFDCFRSWLRRPYNFVEIFNIFVFGFGVRRKFEKCFLRRKTGNVECIFCTHHSQCQIIRDLRARGGIYRPRIPPQASAAKDTLTF